MTSLENFRSFGESLKAARIEQKRSLDDLASAIKINRKHLEAIESGDLSKLPQGPYVAAFLREYARALKLTVPSDLAPISRCAPCFTSRSESGKPSSWQLGGSWCPIFECSAWYSAVSKYRSSICCENSLENHGKCCKSSRVRQQRGDRSSNLEKFVG